LNVKCGIYIDKVVLILLFLCFVLIFQFTCYKRIRNIGKGGLKKKAI